MMKVKMIALVLTVLASLSVSANESKTENRAVFVGDTQYAGFCKAVVSDDLALFKRNISKNIGWLGSNRDSVQAKVLENNNISCNDQGLKAFAEARQAKNILAYLNGEQLANDSEQLVKYTGDKAFAGFCKAIVNDDPALFNRSLKNQVGIIGHDKEQVLSLVLDAANVRCSGLGLVEFSEKREAKQLVAYLNEVKS